MMRNINSTPSHNTNTIQQIVYMTIYKMLSYINMFFNKDYRMSTPKMKEYTVQKKIQYIGPGPHKRKTGAPDDWLRELGQQDLLRETNSERVSSGNPLTALQAPQNTPSPQLSGPPRCSNALHLDKQIQGCQKTTHEW